MPQLRHAQITAGRLRQAYWTILKKSAAEIEEVRILKYLQETGLGRG